MSGFPKTERLCSKTLISRVFSEGKPITDFPIKAIYLLSEFSGNPSFKVLFTIPRKVVRHSVHRNLVRRRMKEAFRINKHILSEALIESGKQLTIVFIFIGRTEPLYSELEPKIIGILQRLRTVNEKLTQ